MSPEVNIKSQVIKGERFHLQSEAKDLPSIGKVQIAIETKEIEWE